MNSRKTYFVMIGVLFLLGIIAIGVLVGSTIFIKNQSQRLVQLKLEKRLLTEQESSLVQAKKDIAQYAELDSIAEAVVPQDKDQARAVREIIGIADEVGIKIKSINFSSSSLGAANTAPQPNQSSDGNSGSEGGGSKPAAPPVSQAKPVDGVPGIYSLEISIIPDATTRPVTYYQFLDFLERIENNRRTAQVTRVKIDPVTADSQNPYITFTLTINIFIKP